MHEQSTPGNLFIRASDGFMECRLVRASRAEDNPLGPGVIRTVERASGGRWLFPGFGVVVSFYGEVVLAGRRYRAVCTVFKAFRTGLEPLMLLFHDFADYVHRRGADPVDVVASLDKAVSRAQGGSRGDCDKALQDIPRMARDYLEAATASSNDPCHRLAVAERIVEGAKALAVELESIREALGMEPLELWPGGWVEALRLAFHNPHPTSLAPVLAERYPGSDECKQRLAQLRGPDTTHY